MSLIPSWFKKNVLIDKVGFFIPQSYNLQFVLLCIQFYTEYFKSSNSAIFLMI